MTDVTQNTNLFQVYPSWAARVGVDGVPPEFKFDLNTSMVPRRVVLSAGGMNQDYAEFEWIDQTANPSLSESDLLGESPSWIRRRQRVRRQLVASHTPFSSDFSKFCELAEVVMPSQDSNRGPDDDGKWDWQTANRRVFIGDLVITDESSAGDESYRVTACLKPYLFGEVFSGIRWYHKQSGTWVTVDGSDLSANPVVDGVSLPSMSDKLMTDLFGEEKAVHGWAHPEIAKNFSSSVYHGQNIQPWTLMELVNAICWTCNPDEEFIRNPFLTEMTQVFDGAPPIEDVLLEGGRYLPYYLDSLLHPLGYNWFVDADDPVPEDEDDEVLIYKKPRIRIFRKGYGDIKELNFQEQSSVNLVISSTAEPQEDNVASDVNQYSLHRDVGNSYNRVRIFGDYLRAEVTVPLHPGWLELYDSKTPDELDEESEDFEDFRDVQRLWIANEGADYSGMRTTKYPTPDPPDFSLVFAVPGEVGSTDALARRNSKSVCVRRNIEPPLTFMNDKKVRRDLLLEVSYDSGTTWKEVVNGWAVLPDQIGVYFTGKTSPIDDPEWRVAFEDDTLRMRITGTISSDHRLVNDPASQTADFPVLRREQVLDLHRHAKYRWWYVVRESDAERGVSWATLPYKSVLADSVYGAEEHDDRQEMNEYAEKLVAQAKNAEFEFECAIPGWHLDWYIGDLLRKINGRDVSLDQSNDPRSPAYCQVVGIEYYLDESEGPMTILRVDRGTRYVSDVYERRKRRLNRVEVH